MIAVMNKIVMKKRKKREKKDRSHLGFCEFYVLNVKKAVYITYKNTLSNTTFALQKEYDK